MTVAVDLARAEMGRDVTSQSGDTLIEAHTLADATATGVASALGAKPRLLGGLDALAAGRPADEDTLATVAAAAAKQCRPLVNVPYDQDWRHAMVPVMVTRALRDAFEGGGR